MKAPQKQLKVLLLGDRCIDYYHYIKSQDRKNPENSEAGIYEIVKTERSMGMACNVEEALLALGFEVVPIWQLENIPCTTTKSRYFDSETGKYLYRIDNEDPVRPFSLATVKYALENFDYHAVVISDYCKGALGTEVLNYVVQNTPKKAPIFVDSKRTDLSIFTECIIKINQLEASKVYKVPSAYDLVVTLGEKGAQFTSMGKDWSTHKEYSGFKVKTVDVCGAGDMFLAGLVYGVLYRYGNNCIDIANAYAAISVSKPGIYVPSLSELNYFMENYNK